MQITSLTPKGKEKKKARCKGKFMLCNAQKGEGTVAINLCNLHCQDPHTHSFSMGINEPRELHLNHYHF